MKKFNWGYKIAILYGAFVIMISYLAVRASTQKVDLVSEDYYEQELNFQKKIDMLKRTNNLVDSVSYQATASNMEVTLPAPFNGKQVSGFLKLYCPSNAANDQLMQFKVENNKLNIPFKKAAKGYYQVQLEWEVAGVAYLNEKYMSI